jgi:hypothetical protein
VLDAVRALLRQHGLLPILFDFDKPASRTILETVGTLARLARFIVADITDPKSIPQELAEIVKALPSVPVQPILQEGSEPWSMFESVAIYPWVHGLVRYRDLPDLLDKLPAEVLRPAEEKAAELGAWLQALRQSLGAVDRRKEESVSVRRALCIGIDDYPGPESLNGCTNDARAWRDVLAEVCGLPPGDIALLLDKAATRKGILAAVDALLSDLAKGDVAVLTMSCHGSYLVGESASGLQPVLCPHDVETAHIELAELVHLARALAEGVRLTVVLDTGFTGTVTRVALSESLPGVAGSDERRVRFLSPALMGRQLARNPWSAQAGEADWNALVLMAAGPQQYAFEGFVRGEYRGTFSYAAVEAIRAAGGKLTPTQLMKQTGAWLLQHGFPQRPCAAGKLPKGRSARFR